MCGYFMYNFISCQNSEWVSEWLGLENAISRVFSLPHLPTFTTKNVVGLTFFRKVYGNFCGPKNSKSSLVYRKCNHKSQIDGGTGTYNTMLKGLRMKRQTMIDTTQHQKWKRSLKIPKEYSESVKDWVTWTPLETVCIHTQVLRKSPQFLFHLWYASFNFY